MTSGDDEKPRAWMRRRFPPPWEIYESPWLNGLQPDAVAIHPEYVPFCILVAENDAAVDDLKIVGRATMLSDARASMFGVEYRPVVILLTSQSTWRFVCGSWRKPPPPPTNPTLLPRNTVRGERALRRLRPWLVEPDLVAMRQEVPKLNNRQRELIEGRTSSGWRRLRGPAGSGKSYVIAGRAARLAEQGKRVLVVHYNITLGGYLRRLIDQFNTGAQYRCTITHYHGWAKQTAHLLGCGASFSSILAAARGGFPHAEINELLAKALSLGVSHDLMYDAILVDEGQDFDVRWLTALATCMEEGGEFLLVSDATQNVYSRNLDWLDSKSTNGSHLGFRGKPVELKESYRLPGEMLARLSWLASRLKGREVEVATQVAQAELTLSFNARWIQLEDVQWGGDYPGGHMAVLSVVSDEVGQMMAQRAADEALSAYDITVLVPDHRFGGGLLCRLEDDFPGQCIGTFSREAKIDFWESDHAVRVTTIHSFKGWEGRALIVVVPQCGTSSEWALLYTALTRLKYHPLGCFITVICLDPTIATYPAQNGWEFESRSIGL